MNTFRRILFIVLGLALLVGPSLLRMGMGYDESSYVPPQALSTSVAATPVSTATSVALALPVAGASAEMRSGPVVVDLAHGNRLNRNQYEPLAAALARRGVGLRFWLSEIDVLEITNFLDYPDQSEALAALLKDASALVVGSPFFLWSSEEIALVEQFVADGGRLLLVSDPDMMGDFVQAVNDLAEPFGVVFNDDYLYDTTENDGNFVHIFQGEFLGEAADLAGSTIALYGARSISGEIAPLALSIESTLSSVRTGVSRFTTLAQGGLEARGTAGRVLALGDFDALTASYVERHDNNQLMEFVAGFLAGGERADTVIDFPAFLGRQVALVFGDETAVDAKILEEGARLQRSLEQSGRELILSGTSTLSAALSAGAIPASDIILVADYATVGEKSTLLADLGFSLVEEVVVAEAEEAGAAESVTATVPLTETGTPTAVAPALDTSATNTSATNTGADTPSVAPTPVPTPTPGATEGVTPITQQAGTPTVEPVATVTVTIPATVPVTETVPVTDTVPVTVTPSAESTPDTPAESETISPTVTPDATPTPTPAATPTPTPTPQVTTYLQAENGLRLLAPQTVLIVQRPLGETNRLVAVLGNDAEGIRAGIGRLLASDYTGCITGPDVAVCSFADGQESGGAAERSDAGERESGVVTPSAATPPVSTTPEVPSPLETPVPNDEVSGESILVIDDNDVVGPDETSEADLYLRVLTAAGYQPDLWTTATDDAPTRDDLVGYRWVIWSSGAYEGGGPQVIELDPVLAYISDGGRLTISSRQPFFGMGTEDASAISDVVVDSGLPVLVEGLPTEPIALPEGLPPVIPLETNPADEGPQIVLRRGPTSSNAGAPVIFVATDDEGTEATGARLIVVGMSMTWLPDEVSEQLVRNMATWMMEE